MKKLPVKPKLKLHSPVLSVFPLPLIPHSLSPSQAKESIIPNPPSQKILKIKPALSNHKNRV